MQVTPDVIGSLIALVGVAGMLFGGIYALLRQQARQIDARFEKVDARFDALEAKFDKKIDGLTHDVVEIKVAIARLEGPQSTLLRSR